LEKLLVNIDGCAQGNPGEAAIGVVICDHDGNIKEEISCHIGRTTNNIAEYKALIEGCKAALTYAPDEVIFFTDSLLLANQINGLFRCREPHLENLNAIARDLLVKFTSWKVRYVERGANWRAHSLAQKALEGKRKNRGLDITNQIIRRVEKLSELDKRKILEYINKLEAQD
jgi:ribonuclease HI